MLSAWCLVLSKERKKKMTVKGYAKFLLIMAGLGGLLYGVDVGVIAAALPYIERTSTFTQSMDFTTRIANRFITRITACARIVISRSQRSTTLA